MSIANIYVCMYAQCTDVPERYLRFSHDVIILCIQTFIVYTYAYMHNTQICTRGSQDKRGQGRSQTRETCSPTFATLTLTFLACMCEVIHTWADVYITQRE